MSLLYKYSPLTKTKQWFLGNTKAPTEWWFLSGSLILSISSQRFGLISNYTVLKWESAQLKIHFADYSIAMFPFYVWKHLPLEEIRVNVWRDYKSNAWASAHLMSGVCMRELCVIRDIPWADKASHRGIQRHSKRASVMLPGIRTGPGVTCPIIIPSRQDARNLCLWDAISYLENIVVCKKRST